MCYSQSEIGHALTSIPRIQEPQHQILSSVDRICEGAGLLTMSTFQYTRSGSVIESAAPQMPLDRCDIIAFPREGGRMPIFVLTGEKLPINAHRPILINKRS